MCNLYSHTRNVEAIRRLFRVTRIDPGAGNLPSQPSIFPAYDAPVVRLAEDGARELTRMHWGFVLPQAGKAAKIINNTRDDKALSSGFWKASFAERRCLLPATAFAEYHPGERDAKGHKKVVWLGLRDAADDLPLFAFAGIWRHWRGNLKGELVEIDCCSMMTTTPNDVVKPIHPTRMPVILEPDDFEAWLTAPAGAALALCRPLAPDRMEVKAVTARGEDPPVAAQACPIGSLPPLLRLR